MGIAFAKPEYIPDLERYLDATRATLLFSRAVILVEGPAEQFLIPPLVKHVMGVDLDSMGVAVVPIHGVHFEPYAALFGEDAIPKRCAIVADGDLKPSDADFEDTDEDLSDIQFGKHDLEALKNKFVKVFCCKTTFEKAITRVGTLGMLSAACDEVGAKIIAAKLRAGAMKVSKIADAKSINDVMEPLRCSVLSVAKRVGKARFAQVVSKHVDKAKIVPDYIREAVAWVNIDAADKTAASGG
jgi:putative ATP-dependent endonuclease of OLD family